MKSLHRWEADSLGKIEMAWKKEGGGAGVREGVERGALRAEEVVRLIARYVRHAM